MLSVDNIQRFQESKFWDIYIFLDFDFIGFKLFSLISFLILISNSTIFKLLSVYYSSRYASWIGKDISNLTFDSTIRLPYKYQININKSICISLLTDKLNRLVSMIMGLLNTLLNLLIAIFIIISMALINFKITVNLITILALIYLLILLKVKRNLSNIGNVLSRDASKRISILNDTLSHIKDVIIGQQQNYVSNKFEIISKRIFDKKADGEIIKNLPKPIIETTGIILIASVGFYFSEIDNYNSKNLLPLLATFAVGFQRLLPNLQSIYSSWTRIRVCKSSVISILNVIDKYKKFSQEKDLKSKAPQNMEDNWELNFRKVCFRYETNNQNVLSNVDLKIKGGERIGVIGHSGSGKSTFVDLLVGLLQPSTGKILLNNQDLHADDKFINLVTWWSHLSLVPQEIFLYNNSIYKNINPFLGNIKDDNYAWDVLKSVGLFKFVDSLPDKLNTTVGEDGTILSGGQKQRISIAKALYKKSKIIIFDESTSALDPRTEKLFLNTIKNLDKKLTIIMISHKFSSLTLCDRILKIESNQLIEITDRALGDYFKN